MRSYEEIIEGDFLDAGEQFEDAFNKEKLILPQRTIMPVKSVPVRGGRPPMTIIKIRPSTKPKIIAIPKRPPLGRPVQRPVKPTRPPIFKGRPVKGLPRKRPPFGLPIDTPILWDPSKRKPPLPTKPSKLPKRGRPMGGGMRKRKPPIPKKKVEEIKEVQTPGILSDKQVEALNQIREEKGLTDKKPDEKKSKKWTTKKKLIVGLTVVAAIGIGGYLIYKKVMS